MEDLLGEDAGALAGVTDWVSALRARWQARTSAWLCRSSLQA
jgi:hypothetical protein